PCSLFLESTTSCVPILLFTHGIRIYTETGQLRSLTQAALDLSEPGKLGESDDVVPQCDRVVGRGEPADHRPEERGTGRRLEVQDRGADVAARESEGLFRLGADLVVKGLVIQRIGEIDW